MGPHLARHRTAGIVRVPEIGEPTLRPSLQFIEDEAAPRRSRLSCFGESTTARGTRP